ncbi:hypothetical protein SAMN04488498_1765 [Mesorhizobium albiziae]|uniref:Uncharacterized protein n=1 Tax=Neomesorhizobium albiziae TaxID=335020 RepID=A0A1I4G2Q0_9HYPH|nr:hypothetical protein SAMN04488498_1765 [Mesorhizobium albiziae]
MTNPVRWTRQPLPDRSAPSLPKQMQHYRARDTGNIQWEIARGIQSEVGHWTGAKVSYRGQPVDRENMAR